jgi:mRNA interferase RelE/StbE
VGRSLPGDVGPPARHSQTRRFCITQYLHIRDIIDLFSGDFIAIITSVKTIVFTHSAAKDLDALPEDARDSVTNGLFGYATTGQGDVKKLSGREGYRLRIGAYRVIFSEDAVTILAIYIGRRATTTYGRN